MGVNIDAFKEFVSQERASVQFENIHNGNQDTVKPVDLCIRIVSDAKEVMYLFKTAPGPQAFALSRRLSISDRLERNDWIWPMERNHISKTVLAVLERVSKRELGVNLTHSLKAAYKGTLSDRIQLQPYAVLDHQGVLNIVADIDVKHHDLQNLKREIKLSPKAKYTVQM